MQISKHYLIALIAALFLGGYLLLYPNEASRIEHAETPATSTEPAVSPDETKDAKDKTTAAAPAPAPKPPAPSATPKPPAPASAPSGSMYKEFVRPTGFLNTYTLNLPDRNTFQLRDFVGKQVIVLNFWTSSSPNALRMFPYLTSWQNKYKDKGLLVVSVHTPRFAFERTQDTVSRATFAWNVIHPIVLDNNFETWNAYKNTVWPTTYLIDINGRIAGTYVGEGSYEPIEAKIQQLLLARADKLGLPRDVYLPFVPPINAVSVDLARAKSPETHFGAARNTSLANGSALREGNQDFSAPSGTPAPNKLYLVGSWNIAKEYASALASGAAVQYHYDAKRVEALLGGSGALKVKVLRDGAPLPERAAGKDVRYEKGESVIYVSERRIYELVNDSDYGAHTLELVFDHTGVEIYTLAFS